MHFSCIEDYEDLASSVELQVQQLLRAHHYNTVGNFVRMYEEFRASGESRLEAFYRRYTPPITPEHHTCVGLGLELLRRLRLLDAKFPGIADKLHLVSCEESIEGPSQYMRDGAPPVMLSEKEHVLVALHVNVTGRPGVLLLDPGYHVARVVTCMADGQYPHTGWFTQKDDGRTLKEYNYSLDLGSEYVTWHIQDTVRPSGATHQHLSLVYIGRPFLRPVQCTERRNLVYNFKSLLSRDTKGHVLAGLYFNLEPVDSVTLFCQADEGQVKRKLAFSVFLQPHIPAAVAELVDECADQLRMSEHQLLALLRSLAVIAHDKPFIEQTLSINARINKIAEDN